MDSKQVIFDISSDEETASFEEMRGGGHDDDLNWLAETLEAVDRETADSSDEVVVVGEYTPLKPKLKSKSLKLVKDVVIHDEDDGDCVVLDSDPEKAVNVVDYDVDNDGDDVLVVGQKGQIACRDYPHPRHLCAKYPFSSTPHERHCELCHCFVCDSLAPCAHWATGVPTFDHCHATDKLDTWKHQRESFRLGKYVPLPVSEYPDVQLPVPVHQLNQVAPREIIQLAPNLGTHNKVCRPITIRACSSARSGVPNIISQTRSRWPGYVQGRNGYMSRSVTQQPVGVGIHNNPVPRLRDRGQQFISSNAMFKRPGIIRGSAVAVNQSVYGSSNNMNSAPASHNARNAVQRTAVNSKNISGWQGVLPPNMISDSYTCPSPPLANMVNVGINSVSLLSEPHCQPVPQSNDGRDVSQYGNQSQNVVDSRFFDFDFDWLNNLSQSNQQFLVENIHLNTGHNNEPTTVKQLSSQFTESTEHHHKDHDYESWFLPQSDTVAPEGCVPADLNVFSPEPSAFDAAG
ncbi:uncharacterized protein LOC8276131 isoform X2 [Ricinus communis]|uniref:uncharacterized protein LOC8276131 isoform X2 n=1 Tax=Ricinus communis TaxID=3988 RepID=UPI00201A8BF2|nr:uncharacterized protein LOC8276131 isoform X2 [Ricinus communis]